MHSKPIVTARVSGDKLIMELDLPAVRLHVASFNRVLREINENNPSEPLELYRITNGRAFLKYLAARLGHRPASVAEDLADMVGMVIEENLADAAQQGAGIEELPWDTTEAEGMLPSRGRKR